VSGAALLACGALLAGAATVPPEAGVVLLRQDCGSRLDRREVTLFANGTVRLRQGAEGRWRMDLVELERRELDGYLARLAAEDVSEFLQEPAGPVGDWVERCRLELRLPGRPPREVVLGRLQAPPLPLARVAAVAEELAARVERGARIQPGLPEGYAPRPGDVLRRADGLLFEIVAFTGDGGGVELAGVDQPLTVYVPRGALASEFVALVERRAR
jgi:hypothetical protein